MRSAPRPRIARDEQWIPNCDGHWDCLHSECRPACDTVVCRQAADCVLLAWPKSCEGYWECGEDGSCRAVCHGLSCNEQIPFHPPTLDPQGGLLPWIPYHQLVETVLGWIRQCPTSAVTGLPWYLQYPSFRYQNMCPSPWPHNPAGLYAMMVETLVRYLPYSGDRSFVEPTRVALDRLIADSTPAGFAWPHVPYASADNSGRYHGGSAEGFEGIEPDKVAQAAVAYLRFGQLTGDAAYREEARHCAQVLADRIREGDEDRSPWPFRVNARTGAVLEEYSSDLVWPIALFDELERDGTVDAGHGRGPRPRLGMAAGVPADEWKVEGIFRGRADGCRRHQPRAVHARRAGALPPAPSRARPGVAR